MKVTINTQSELVFRHRPRILPLLLGLLVLAVVVQAFLEFETMSGKDLIGTVLGVSVCTVIVGLASRQSEFHFDTARGDLRWAQWGPFWRSQGVLRLEEIGGVTIETNRYGAGECNRVVLLTRQGRLPLTWHYSSFEPHSKIAEAIRLWLNDRGFGKPST